jgi:hypothetical protein
VPGKEAVGAVLAAGHAGDDHVPGDGERRRGGRIVLPPVLERRVPQQLARETVQRQQVRIVGDHEEALARDGDAAVRMADRALGPRALVAPDLPARAGIEREALVRVRHVHDARDDDRGGLRAAAAGNREDPLRREPRHVAPVDLRHRGVAIAARIAVVGRPVDRRRDLAEAAGIASQQVHALVVAEDLHVVEAFGQQHPFERLAIGHRRRPSHDRLALGPPLDRAEEREQVAHLAVTEIGGRHAAWRNAGPDQLAELLVVAGREPLEDRRPHLAAGAVGSVTARTSALERLPAGQRGLTGDDGGGAEHGGHRQRNGSCPHDCIARGRAASTDRGSKRYIVP